MPKGDLKEGEIERKEKAEHILQYATTMCD